MTEDSDSNPTLKRVLLWVLLLLLILGPPVIAVLLFMSL